MSSASIGRRTVISSLVPAVGSSHLYSLYFKNNLAALYQRLGQLDRAEVLARGVLDATRNSAAALKGTMLTPPRDEVVEPPVFVTMITCGALTEPRATSPKFTAAGVAEIAAGRTTFVATQAASNTIVAPGTGPNGRPSPCA